MTEHDTIAFAKKNACRNIYNKMPWHNNSISVSEMLPVAAAATAAAGSSDEPTKAPGTSSSASGRLSKDVRPEAPNSSAEVGRERPRPVAIVFGMKRSPRMNRFRDGLTLGAEEVGSPREIQLETKPNASEESSNTKIVLESEETSVPKQTSIGESMISGFLPPQPCVCGSGCCQSVEEVMTLPIILQWKGDCFSSAPTHVKSEVFCGGTMKTFTSYSEDSPDVVLRETLV